MSWAFVFYVVSAFVFGVVIGVERQLGQHPAGLRTNALVALGSALFVSVSLMSQPADATRVVGQVVTGIGFLGGGVILREGLNVRGLNTAATLWCSAAVGCLCGLGLIWEAMFGTSLIVMSNLCLRPLAERIDSFSLRKGLNHGREDRSANDSSTSGEHLHRPGAE